jgi:RecB family exonuclease
VAAAPTLSYSGFRTYAECPLRWKFLYVDHLREKPRSFFSFGRSVHAALEAFVAPLVAEGEPPGKGAGGQRTLQDFSAPAEVAGGAATPMDLPRLLDLYRTAWVSEGYTSAQEEQNYFDLGVDLLTRFHSAFLKEPPRPVAVEKDLRAELDGVPIHGIVDRLDRTAGGGLEVLDYKTSKELSLKDAQLSDQLTLYQVLVEQNYERPVEALTLYHLRSLNALKTPRRPAEALQELGIRLGEVSDGIRSEHYEPRVGSWCRWCDFRPLCPEFKEVPAGSRDRVTALVDRYAELLSVRRRTREEMEAIDRELEALAKDLGVHRLRGRTLSLHRQARRTWRFPPESTLALLRSHALEARAGGMDPERAAALLKDPEVPARLRRQLAGQGTLELDYRWEPEGPDPP